MGGDERDYPERRLKDNSVHALLSITGRSAFTEKFNQQTKYPNPI